MSRKKPWTVLPGYPKSFTFQCREEVDEYLSGQTIVCLLCGNGFRQLDAHLKGMHKISSDEYREIYGLPFMRGLCAGEYTAWRSEFSKDQFEKNRDRQLRYLAQAKAVQAENGNPQRHKPRFWKNERTGYTREHFEEFARRVLSGRAGLDVEQDDDMPSKAHVLWYMKRNKDFAQQWDMVVRPIAKVGWKPQGRPKRTQNEASQRSSPVPANT